MNRRWPAIPLLLALTILWRFEHDVKDVLEAQSTLGGSWMEWPGPYKLAPNKDGSFSYVVEVPKGNKRMFFRIRREWGRPNVGPVLPNLNTKTKTQ